MKRRDALNVATEWFANPNLRNPAALAVVIAQFAKEERVERDRLWCATVIRCLPIEEMPRFLGDFNAHRPNGTKEVPFGIHRCGIDGAAMRPEEGA